jgi:isocitrate dehydrogenase
MENTPITVAYGDGIGPEIMEAVIYILKEAHAPITIETIDIGKLQYEHGFTSGIAPNAWESLRRTRLLLKAPITTPQGGGYKSLNVTLRKAMGLYANVRPCKSYEPFVPGLHKNMDMVIIRENEEDLYTGIEYRPTDSSYECVKLITRQGSEKIIRYAFEYARRNGRKKVTCMSKDNIMKMADGLFHRCFDEIASEYSEIQTDHFIIDIGAARIASKPTVFDVIVTENLYGDIISDIAAEVSGSVGLAGSANIGANYAMFEAIHGSAPDIAGKGLANPSGLLQAAVMLLVHIGASDCANKIHNAWLATIENGIHTADVFQEGISKERVSTMDFVKAVRKHFGQKPKKFAVVEYKSDAPKVSTAAHKSHAKSEIRQMVGVDIYLQGADLNAESIAETFKKITSNTRLKLQIVSAKGLKLWPQDGILSLGENDLWCVRLLPEGENKTASLQDQMEITAACAAHKIDIVKIVHLYTYGNALGFTVAQGQ